MKGGCLDDLSFLVLVVCTVSIPGVTVTVKIGLKIKVQMQKGRSKYQPAVISAPPPQIHSLSNWTDNEIAEKKT